MGVKVENNGCFGSGQTWTLRHADPSGTSGVARTLIECPQRSSQSNTQYYMLNDERTIEKELREAAQLCQCDAGEHEAAATLGLERVALCLGCLTAPVAPTPCAPCGIVLKEVA